MGVAYENGLHGKGPVLLVDDNTINRMVTARMIQNMDFSCEEALNGACALRLLRSKPRGYYSFVLMDLNMPVMDGFTAIKEIKNDPSLSDLTVIAMSASSKEEQMIDEIYTSGYLQKPFSTIQLEALLSSIVLK